MVTDAMTSERQETKLTVTRKRRKQAVPSASLPAFTWDQAADVRKGKLGGCLITAAGRPPKPDSIRALRRRHRKLDGDGKHAGGYVTEQVTDQTEVEGEKVKVLIALTILTVTKKIDVSDLTLEHAKACGYQTADGLRQSWLAAHPRTQLVRVITFACGDVRDRQPFMRYGAGETMIASMSPDPEVPKIPAEAQAKISVIGHARDMERLSDPIRRKRDEAEKVLTELYELLPPGKAARDRIRRLERELQHLNRDLAA